MVRLPLYPHREPTHRAELHFTLRATRMFLDACSVGVALLTLESPCDVLMQASITLDLLLIEARKAFGVESTMPSPN